VELVPNDPDFGYVYAVALHEAGENGPARRALKAVLSHQPNHVPSLLLAVDFARRAGRPKEACAALQRLGRLHPVNPRVHAAAGEVDCTRWPGLIGSRSGDIAPQDRGADAVSRLLHLFVYDLIVQLEPEGTEHQHDIEVLFLVLDDLRATTRVR